MIFKPRTETPPLHEDASGALRVGNSRVLLELVIDAFQAGVSPESIVEMYATLSLADVYAVIGYYLRHPTEMDDYLKRARAEGDELQRTNERFQGDLSELRSRILKRRET